LGRGIFWGDGSSGGCCWVTWAEKKKLFLIVNRKERKKERKEGRGEV
jgi:hypothetical protein